MGLLDIVLHRGFSMLMFIAALLSVWGFAFCRSKNPLFSLRQPASTLPIYNYVVLFASTFSAAVFFSPFLQAESSDRPNVVLLLADDLGCTGLGCFGSDLYETPNLDALAESMEWVAPFGFVLVFPAKPPGAGTFFSSIVRQQCEAGSRIP